MVTRFRSRAGLPITSHLPVPVVTSWTRVREVKEPKGNFYNCVRWTLLSCRFMGLLPISGLWNRSSDLTRCTWKSPYTLIYAPSITVQVISLFIRVYYYITHQIPITKIVFFFFTALDFMSCLFILKMSINWRNMLKEIESIEKKLPPLKNPRRIVRVIRCTNCILLSIAFVEHLLFHITTYNAIKQFYLLPDDSGLCLKSYFTIVLDRIFEMVPFDYTIAIINMFSMVQMTYMWTFVDVLLIVITLYLNDRFRNFNNLIKKQHKLPPNLRISWSELRGQYNCLSQLVKIIDQNINPFVFASFSSNLFFIAERLFNIISLHYDKNFYFGVSLTFVMGKMMTVAFVVAHLHALSREPLNVLHTVPASAYDFEMQQLMDQVYHSTIALSGFELFYVTREIILCVLATLITYELVLFQFQTKRANL